MEVAPANLVIMFREASLSDSVTLSKKGIETDALVHAVRAGVRATAFRGRTLAVGKQWLVVRRVPLCDYLRCVRRCRRGWLSLGGDVRRDCVDGALRNVRRGVRQLTALRPLQQRRRRRPCELPAV